MAGGFTPEFLEELKFKCDIVSIVSQYVPLVKKGPKYFGCCPFHSETAGSFCVNTDGQYYHCFGCGVSGNVIGFIMEMESLSYGDAVRYLAEKAGMPLPEFRSDPEYRVKKERREVLKQLMLDAARYYRSNLAKENEGREAREYLDGRGINDEIRKRFGIGLSLDYDSLQGYMRRKGYSIENLNACGLVVGERLSDAFAGRIIVPIMNGMGDVVAFGGRIYRGETNVAKYKNSTNTELFDKSRTLYGVNFVKREKKSGGGFKELVLVEGYMDVIALAAAGVRNAVAAMGTALTPGQAQELKRLAPTVYVCYDGDAAGRKAAVKNVDTLQDAGLEVKVVSLADGFDPDDTVRKEGVEAFYRRLNEALPVVEYKLKLCADAGDLNSVDGRAKYVAAALKVLSSIGSQSEREVYLGVVSGISGVSVEALKRDTGSRAKERAEPPAARAEREATNVRASRFVLSKLLANAPYADPEEVNADWLPLPAHRAILSFALSQPRGKVCAGAVFDALPGEPEASAVVGIDEKLDSEAREREYYADCLARLANEYITARLRFLKDRYNELNDSDEKRAALNEIGELQRKLKSRNVKDKF